MGPLSLVSEEAEVAGQLGFLDVDKQYAALSGPENHKSSLQGQSVSRPSDFCQG
jgi:hypothetical protein